MKVEIEFENIPEGYEPVRFGFPERGELVLSMYGEDIEVWIGGLNSAVKIQRMIIRKKWKPEISLKSGSWLYKERDVWCVSSSKPIEGDNGVLYSQSGFVVPKHIITFNPPPDGLPRQIT